MNIYLQNYEWEKSIQKETRNGIIFLHTEKYTKLSICGIALQKGIYFNIGAMLCGRDGISCIVDEFYKTNDYSEKICYIFVLRIMTLLDFILYTLIFPLLISFVVLFLIINIILFVALLIGMLINRIIYMFMYLCIDSIHHTSYKIVIYYPIMQNLWITCGGMILCSIGSIFAHIILFPILILNFIIPELITKYCKLQKMGR